MFLGGLEVPVRLTWFQDGPPKRVWKQEKNATITLLEINESWPLTNRPGFKRTVVSQPQFVSRAKSKLQKAYDVLVIVRFSTATVAEILVSLDPGWLRILKPMSLRMGLFVGLVDPGIWLRKNKNIPRQSTIYELLIEVFSAVKFLDVLIWIWNRILSFLLINFQASSKHLNEDRLKLMGISIWNSLGMFQVLKKTRAGGVGQWHQSPAIAS